MRQSTASLSARAAPAAPDHDDRDGTRPEASRVWAVLGALAYAGAFIDPSGILAVQRLRQAQEEEERNGRR
jgi:hypothetical protein